MKKTLVFDTGPIINLALNNLLGILEPLKERFKGDFLIPVSVKKELIDRPLQTKRFEFEALRILRHMRMGTLTIFDDITIRKDILKLLDIANSIYMAKNHNISVVHFGEMDALATCIRFDSAPMVVDERTTRKLVEAPDELAKRLKKKLHTKISINESSLKEFSKRTKKIRFIRSAELATLAYEYGMLDQYLPDIKDSKRILIDALLWGLKLNGCAISEEEIDEILKLEFKKK